ncbi:hypothetical protein Tco_0657601 [Tanacetum coccineum]
MAEQDIPPPTITAMKIPIIRKGEYDIWSMRMRQYICHTDHNLWDVIVNGDLEEEPAPTGETSAPPAPKTAKQLAAKRNQERVKSILLLAIPDEYLLKFHNVADAKSLWEAIKSRFGGNEESKKMQKNVLKHQFENKSIGGSWSSNIKGRYQPKVPNKSSSFMLSQHMELLRKAIDIRPIYNEEPMAEVQTTAKINIFATGQKHPEQLEFNNEGKVDQNAEQCYDTCHLPAKLNDDKIIELLNQLLESEKVCLKKTVAQCQKDFSKLEAHCINLELKYQNQVLKEGQQDQFLNVRSNEAKVKTDIDVTETINIELEHSVAKLLAENEQLHKEKEHLKQTYKDLFDSIKRTRVQTKDQNDSLMAQLNKKSNENADVLAQIQKKGFAIAALKNELRKLTGNSVNTKFAKPSILGKPVGQPLKNQSVVRQPTAFKSERPRISKPRFASQVDVNNDLSKPVTTHHLPKGRESAPAKPHHMIAPSSSRYSSNDIVHNHYLEEAKKKTHEHSRIPRNFSDSKHFVCSTCQKCVFNANHDACVIKFLKEVNSRAKVPSNKTTNRNKPVEQIRVATKPKRQIPKGHRFSIKKTTTVHEKTTSPRSCLRWQPTGRILKTVCLRWVPTGKTFASSTTKVESEPPNGSNADITNQCESKQALNVSAGTLLSTAVQASVVNSRYPSYSCMQTNSGFKCRNQCQNGFTKDELHQMASAENNTSGPVSQMFKRRLIAVDQALVFMAMMSVHISSGLVLHQMTSDHNHSELGIQDHSNEQSSSKLVPKVVP